MEFIVEFYETQVGRCLKREFLDELKKLAWKGKGIGS
jgi:hypothetical protein